MRKGGLRYHIVSQLTALSAASWSHCTVICYSHLSVCVVPRALIIQPAPVIRTKTKVQCLLQLHHSLLHSSKPGVSGSHVRGKTSLQRGNYHKGRNSISQGRRPESPYLGTFLGRQLATLVRMDSDIGFPFCNIRGSGQGRYKLVHMICTNQ